MHPLGKEPATSVATLRVSEVFHSLQGEGPSTGVPAHFVRLQGCTVGCAWCDTKYSWDTAGGRRVEISGLLEEALALGAAPLLVVSGGEPLESPELRPLLEAALERWERVEVETSGLLPPPLSHPRLAWSVSPKLPKSTVRWEQTWRHAAEWLAEPNATFKIVVGDPPDETDLMRLISAHHIPAGRVMLMPEGFTDAGLRARALVLAGVCKRYGFRLSPRLHVWIWGARRGL
jgi:organic radical activating enzyme